MIATKKIYVADSFEGLPKPDSKYKADYKDPHHKLAHLRVSLEQVQDNFKRYKLLNHRVQFIKGFFKDSLTNVPFKKLAVMRLDGDMYSSTWETLTALYDKLSIGGYIIIDDYSALPACKLAVDDFRRERKIKVTNSLQKFFEFLFDSGVVSIIFYDCILYLDLTQ